MKWIALLLVSVAFAGCAADDATDVNDPVPVIDEPVPRAFAMNVEAVNDWFEAFVSPGKRDAYLPDTPVSFNQASRDVVADTLRMAGFEVTVMGHGRTVGPANTGNGGPVSSYTVEAHWPGNATKQADDMPLGELALIAHYDTQAGTIEGAYDNGSGTAAVVHTCIELSKADLRRDLTCLLFDAEEVGTVASGAYVDATDRNFDLVMGFDMVGLNCPGYQPAGAEDTWKHFQWVGANVAEWLHPFVLNATHGTGPGQSGLSMECAQVFNFNDRNSDESQFASEGFPTVRFAGGRTASSYDEYHMPNDTPEHLYDLAGGKENWLAGFGQTMKTAYELALLFDQTSPEELQQA